MQEIKQGWKKVRIGDLVTVLNGGTPSTKESNFWDGNIVWITPKDLSLYKENKYIDNSIKKITDLGLNKSSAKIVPKKSVILSSRAPVGYVKIVKTDFSTNQGCKSLICNSNILNDYLYYWLKINTKILENASGGATFKELSTPSLKNIEILLPPLPTQQKIASILSKYDDLIENNNKRIKILEEMAQSIYEEWFVNFNFPGSESVKMVYSGNEDFGMVPEGWEVGKIGDLYNVKSGYAFKSKDFIVEGGNYVIKIKNIENNSINLNNTQFVDNEIGKKAIKFLLNKGDILIAMTGATLGKIGLMPIEEKKSYLNQRAGKFFPKIDLINNSFLYFSLLSNKINKTIINLGMGAAQPNISGGQIEGIKLLIPKKNILNKYGEIVNGNFEEILNLQKQNKNLKETRDLLIPRLVAGELDMESLDVK